MARQVKNLTSVCEDAGSVPGLAQWVKDLEKMFKMICFSRSFFVLFFAVMVGRSMD